MRLLAVEDDSETRGCLERGLRGAGVATPVRMLPAPGRVEESGDWLARSADDHVLTPFARIAGDHPGALMVVTLPRCGA